MVLVATSAQITRFAGIFLFPNFLLVIAEAVLAFAKAALAIVEAALAFVEAALAFAEAEAALVLVSRQ